jgi:tetratricopeptide (TPR) repeat protein/CHAT domain-containing protein
MRENDDFTPEQAQSILETYGENLPPEIQATCLCILERFDEALQLLDKALAREPESWQLWSFKGFTLLSLERHAEAVATLDRALELNPTQEQTRQARDEALQALAVENDDNTLYRWFEIPHPLACRRFLEQHPELLAPHIQELTELIYPDLAIPGSPIRESFADMGEGAAEKLDQIRERIEMLRDVHRRGGTRQAIRDACVDAYGGMALELPSWLEMAMGRLSIFAFAGPGEETFLKIATGLRPTLERADQDPDLPPEIRAHLRVFLFEMVEKAADAGNVKAQEESITCLEYALTIYTREYYPRSYAMLQHKLGLVYRGRKTGDSRQNLDEAMRCFKRALTIHTSKAYPKDYAMDKYNLGSILMLAYTSREEEEQIPLRQEALACFADAAQFYTREGFPFEYARILKSLGIIYSDYKEYGRYVYQERVRTYLQQALEILTSERYPTEYAEIHAFLALFYKERAEQGRVHVLEEAISSCKAALSIYTLKRVPRKYASTQQLLGDLYLQRIVGERQSNIEEAIICYERVFLVYTLEHDPQEYAELLNLMGNAYRVRLTGARQGNQEKALAYYQQALKLNEQEGYERGVAKIYYNLAIAYDERITGTYEENQERAFANCQQALEIYMRERFPRDYARSQCVAGSLYKRRIKGNRGENLEEAIRCYERALEIFTPEQFPKDHAETLYSLSDVYLNRTEGSAHENKELALKYYHQVLQFFVREDFPYQFAATHMQLGSAYLVRIVGDQRENKEQAIAHLELALEIFTYESNPLEYAKTHSNLAGIYSERVAGTREQNQETAIDHHRKALKVMTLRDYPDDYAITQDSLGVIYSRRLAGDRRANLEEALVCHQRALQVFTPQNDRINFARTMINLATTYWQRIAGDRHENLEHAITACKAALEILTLESSPFDYARLQLNMGGIYLMQVGGEKHLYQERAIECFERALRIFTPKNDPKGYIAAQSALGSAYSERIEGVHGENIERAITYHNAALRVLKPEEAPVEYAKVQNNLGTCYMERSTGEYTENTERALACFHAALSAHATDPTSLETAHVLINLGITHASLIRGERRANLEQALDYYKRAEVILQADPRTIDYAQLQLNMGNVYARLTEIDEQVSREKAIACCQKALEVYTLEGFPQDYYKVQLNLALIEEVSENWSGAHEAYQNALNAEDLLVALGIGVAGQTLILQGKRDTASQNGYALTRLGRISEAAVSLERGRTRGLVQAMALHAASFEAIHDPDLRVRFEQARRDLISYQAFVNYSSTRAFDREHFERTVDLPSLRGESGRRRFAIIFAEEYQKKYALFQQILHEVVMIQGPLEALSTSVEEDTLLQAAEKCGSGHAIVYLAATSQGGIAVAALSSNPERQTPAHFANLELPGLTRDLLGDLLEDHMRGKKYPIRNSYGAAQAGIGCDWFLANWEGKTFRECAMQLHAACEGEGETSTFDRAAQRTLLANWLANGLVDMPFERMLSADYRKLARTMNDFLLQEELSHCLPILESVALRSLANWLEQEGVTSCTLIPCGPLIAFPLQAVGSTSGKTLADLFLTSIAPNARSLLSEGRQYTEQSALYALGDPRPTRQKLEFGEAEAWTLAALARQHGLPATSRVRQEATREAFAQAVQQSYIVDASCHARFDFLSPLDSALLLANREYVFLVDLLSHHIDIYGLRLLILSACQSSVVDLRGATNEAHSLTAGMIQAGAKAILAPLWSVDDMATYLLIVRFMQEWLPQVEQEPPAAALARAQSWLRNVTARELYAWRALPPVVHSSSRANTPEHTSDTPRALPQRSSTKRADRFDMERAKDAVRNKARSYADPNIRPYANPIYWAGFQVTGW